MYTTCIQTTYISSILQHSGDQIGNLLTHCLAAAAFQCALGALFHFPFISIGIFLAGLLSIIIDLDVELPYSIKTPFAHSVLFAIIWIYVGVIVLSLLNYTSLITFDCLIENSLALVSAYSTHLLIDAFTEGIYTFPRDLRIKDWLHPLPKGSSIAWENWGRFKFRTELSDLSISAASITFIIIFIALTPL